METGTDPGILGPVVNIDSTVWAVFVEPLDSTGDVGKKQ
jgi:hypothetical protein